VAEVMLDEKLLDLTRRLCDLGDEDAGDGSSQSDSGKDVKQF